MKIKICGLKHLENLRELAELQADYHGFIFYPKSERYMKETLVPSDLLTVPGKKVGVFVNSPIEEILNTSVEFHLDTIQLHGNESPDFCARLKELDLEVIKVFKVDNSFDFKTTKDYSSCSDFFLFDTKGKKEGGNGFAFDWNLLNNYDQELPFFLSGGIGQENISQIISLKNMNLYGIDLNSKIESFAGLKDLQKAELMVKAIRQLDPVGLGLSSGFGVKNKKLIKNI